MKLDRSFFIVFMMASAAMTSSAFAQINNQYADAPAAAVEILNRSLGSVGKSSQPDHPANPVAQFIGFIQSGMTTLQPTQQQVCDAWRQMPPDQPFTGIFTVGAFEFSLDKMCGIRP